jgi:hypothetical protein
MSPRAAWRLEALGFTHVYDYAPSKSDWFANGLPREGKAAAIPWAGDRPLESGQGQTTENAETVWRHPSSTRI